MKELTKRLAGSAKENGICEEWGQRLAGFEDTDIDRMMFMYVKGIDFCMDHDWPDLQMIRDHFKGHMEKYGVHCDEECQIKNEQFNVLLGRCKAAMTFDQYEVGEIYIRHETTAEIAANDHAFVYVDVYDGAKVKIIASDHAKVCIKNHGNADIQVERSGDAVIKRH